MTALKLVEPLPWWDRNLDAYPMMTEELQKQSALMARVVVAQKQRNAESPLPEPKSMRAIMLLREREFAQGDK